MVQAVVASATPTDFLSAMSDRQRNQQRTRPPRKMSLEWNPKRFAPNFSCDYASADAPSILLVHAISDRTVGVYHSDKLVKALREAGAKNVSYILLGDDSGHGSFQRISRLPSPAREAFLIVC